VRTRSAVAPFAEEEPLFGAAGVPFTGGNMGGRACGVGVSGEVAADTAAGFSGETAGKGTRCEKNASASSPTRRLFVSVFAGDNFIFGGGERVPNEGD